MSRMMKTVIVAAMLLLPGAAFAGGGVEEAKKGIADVNAKYGAAIEHQDAAAIRDFYTKDAIVLPPEHAMIHGNDGVVDFWNASFKAGVKNGVLTTENVERRADVAVETGTFTMKTQPEGKDAQTATGKYVVVWKRQKDGGWKLHRDIWNATPLAKQ